MAPERRPHHHHHHHHNHRVAKKRVRILPGHEARFIEKRRPARSGCNRVQKRATSTRAKRRSSSSSSTPQATMLGRAAPRTHKPTVAELVYRYLESVSNRGVCKSQKTSATGQFRRHQRQAHPRRLRPELRRHRRKQCGGGGGGGRYNDNNDVDAPRRAQKDCVVVGYDEFKRRPASPCADNDSMYSYTGAKRNIEKCIYEIISIGTVLGLLQPVDKRGLVFRIAPELKLFSDNDKNSGKGRSVSPPEKQQRQPDWDVDRKY